MAAKKKEEAKVEFQRELAVVLQTAFSTNTWNGAAEDIIVCESAEEKSRLLDAQFVRELEEFEPERKQKVYFMAHSHAQAVVVAPSVVQEKKKAANEDEDEDDTAKTGAIVTEDFFNADKLQLKVYKFAGGMYDVIDQEGKTLNDKKLRKNAVVALINSLADKGAN